MTLDKKQLKHLKSLSHALQPVVRVGQKGVTKAVQDELDIALRHHELVKVKIAIGDRAERDTAGTSLAERCAATVVQRIGQTAVLYRRNKKEPVIVFPK